MPQHKYLLASQAAENLDRIYDLRTVYKLIITVAANFFVERFYMRKDGARGVC